MFVGRGLTVPDANERNWTDLSSAITGTGNISYVFNGTEADVRTGYIYLNELVIDDLLHGITQEFNITTIINTHDMNSVMGIGEKVIFIYQGRKEWEGSKDDVFTSTNERLNNFIFASDLLQKVKDVEVQGLEG